VAAKRSCPFLWHYATTNSLSFPTFLREVFPPPAFFFPYRFLFTTSPRTPFLRNKTIFSNDGFEFALPRQDPILSPTGPTLPRTIATPDEPLHLRHRAPSLCFYAAPLFSRSSLPLSGRHPLLVPPPCDPSSSVTSFLQEEEVWRPDLPLQPGSFFSTPSVEQPPDDRDPRMPFSLGPRLAFSPSGPAFSLFLDKR